MNEDINPELARKFPKEQRTQGCIDLMRPEVKELMNLSLSEKIKKSQEIIKESLEKYGTVGLGFSGGTDSLVLLHLALPLCPKDMPVIFSNTHHQFPETYEYIKKIIGEWGVQNFQEVMAEESKLEEFKQQFGEKTPEFTTACCKYHKIDPLVKGISDLNLDAVLVGIRGVEHEERAKESLFSQREGHDRVHVLLFWTSEDVLDYVKFFGIECNPLYARGYTSLGCVLCTELNKDPNAHERAGRGIVREEIMESLRELGYT